MKNGSKYSAGMAARMEAVALENGGLDLALCAELASQPDFQAAGVTARGVVAKARSMGLAYRKVEKVTKTGEPVARKDELVSEIEKALGVEGLDSLSKAEKPALRRLLDAVSALA